MDCASGGSAKNFCPGDPGFWNVEARKAWMAASAAMTGCGGATGNKEQKFFGYFFSKK
jgi:hypothetical protein